MSEQERLSQMVETCCVEFAPIRVACALGKMEGGLISLVTALQEAISEERDKADALLSEEQISVVVQPHGEKFPDYTDYQNALMDRISDLDDCFKRVGVIFDIVEKEVAP